MGLPFERQNKSHVRDHKVVVMSQVVGMEVIDAIVQSSVCICFLTLQT
jgi:hypothetical protein